MSAVLRRMRALVMAAVVSTALLIPAGAANADEEGFWITNTGTSTVVGVYVVHSDVGGDWVPVAGVDRIAPGETLRIDFAVSDPADCTYDLRVETDSGLWLELFGVDLCMNDRVTVSTD